MSKTALDRIVAILGKVGKSEKDLRSLLNDLLTKPEIEDIDKRLKILEGLLTHQSQRKISEKLKVSISKVTRGSQVIKYGSGIFQKLLK